MEKKGLKKLKRKRKLKGRLKCHGDKGKCNHSKSRPAVQSPEIKTPILQPRQSFWARLLKLLRIR